MSLTPNELSLLTAECRKLPVGRDYRVHDYVTNVLNTVLDFQMESQVVGASMRYFDENHSIKSHRKLSATVAGYPNTKSGNLKLAQCLWGYNHWTRAKFLRELIRQFDARNIRGQESLKRWFTSADFETDVKGRFRTKEHSIGIALFHWLQLRLGVDTIKPDVHILNYVENAIGRRPSPSDAVAGLLTVAKRLRRKAYRIDAAIWHYQREEA